MWALVLGQGWDNCKEMFLLEKHPEETQSGCSQALLAWLLLLLLAWENPNVPPRVCLPQPCHQPTRNYPVWPSARHSEWSCGHTAPLKHPKTATLQIMRTPSNQTWPGAEVCSQSSSPVTQELTVLVLTQKASLCKSFLLSNSRQALCFISSVSSLAIIFLWGPTLEFSQGLSVLSQGNPGVYSHHPQVDGTVQCLPSSHSFLDKATATAYFQLLLGVAEPLPHPSSICTQSAEKWWNSPFPKDFQQIMRDFSTLHNHMDANLLSLYNVHWWKQLWNNTR